MGKIATKTPLHSLYNGKFRVQAFFKFLVGSMTSPDLIGRQLRRVGKDALEYFSRHTKTTRLKSYHVAALVGLAAFATPAIVAAMFCTAPSSTGSLAEETSTDALTRVEKRLDIRLPDLRSQMDAIGKKDDSVMHETYVTSADTLRSLLSRLGIRDNDVVGFIEKTPGTKSLLNLRLGQYATASTLENGTLVTLRLYEDAKDQHTMYEITRDGTHLQFLKKPFNYEVQWAMAEGIVQGLPSASLQKSNLPSSIINQMHEAFDYDRDVVNQLKQGEAFRVIYENKYIDGSFVRLGKLLAMQFEIDGKTRDYFWFPDDGQGGHYYDNNGVLTQRTFMRIPLDVKNVSSEFSPMRRHPITGVLRPHRGTDFRAPWGAVVRAAADGKVVFASTGTGYGKYVRIQHGPDYQTLYAHLSSIDPKIKVGSEVQHGQPIGKVGQTGLATGPHLHYELIFNGTQINPMTAELPDTRSLSPYQIAKMEALVAPLQEKLSLLRRVQVSQAKK